MCTCSHTNGKLLGTIQSHNIHEKCSPTSQHSVFPVSWADWSSAWSDFVERGEASWGESGCPHWSEEQRAGGDINASAEKSRLIRFSKQSHEINFLHPVHLFCLLGNRNDLSKFRRTDILTDNNWYFRVGISCSDHESVLWLKEFEDWFYWGGLLTQVSM